MDGHDFKLGFIDLLLCSFVSIVVLFFMTTLLVNPAKKVVQEGLKKDAEFAIHAEWNKDIDCDIDLWVKNPRGTIIYFRAKDADLMNLDRDDFGTSNDRININGAVVLADRNDEYATLRAIVPGKYTVNIHAYTCVVNGRGMEVGDEINVPVRVTLLKLNPRLEIETEANLVMTKVWQERTAFSFDMDANGFVRGFDNSPIKLVTVTKEGTH